MSRYPPAWTGYKPSVTIEGTAYEELEYQFVSRRRKLTIHRRLARDDGGLRRRRFSRTLEHIRSSSVKNLKVNTVSSGCDMPSQSFASVLVDSRKDLYDLFNVATVKVSLKRPLVDIHFRRTWLNVS